MKNQHPACGIATSRLNTLPSTTVIADSPSGRRQDLGAVALGASCLESALEVVARSLFHVKQGADLPLFCSVLMSSKPGSHKSDWLFRVQPGQSSGPPSPSWYLVAVAQSAMATRYQLAGYLQAGPACVRMAAASQRIGHTCVPRTQIDDIDGRVDLTCARAGRAGQNKRDEKWSAHSCCRLHNAPRE